MTVAMKQRDSHPPDPMSSLREFLALPLLIVVSLVGCHAPPDDVPAEPIDEMSVRLVGHDYRFYFQYPGEDLVLGTEDDRYGSRYLHVPQDVLIHLQLDSRDYIYTIEIPELELYEVAVPDLSFEVAFTAKTAGDHELLGSQMCGYDHPELLGKLVVQPVDQFQQSLRQFSKSPLQNTDKKP
jgi:heme/copper-type cytochrome/quinol oxidase subunit 2